MTTPRKRPEPNQPHASRGEKVRNAKGSFQYNTGGGGIGEAPNSRLKMFSIYFVIFLVVLVFVLEYVDSVNEKNEAETRAMERDLWESSAEIPIIESK